MRTRTLGEGEAKILLPHVGTPETVTKNYAGSFRRVAEQLAKRYPDDPIVLRKAAEVLVVSRRYQDAANLADRALALSSNSAEALLVRGRAADGLATADREAPDGWAAGRQFYQQANRADPSSAEALYRYYMSFTRARQTPTAGAVRGVKRAAVLAPESAEIAAALAGRLIVEGDAATARAVLAPVAFAPHSRTNRRRWAEVVTLLDAHKLQEAGTALTAILEDD